MKSISNKDPRSSWASVPTSVLSKNGSMRRKMTRRDGQEMSEERREKGLTGNSKSRHAWGQDLQATSLSLLSIIRCECERQLSIIILSIIM